jgi:exopolysaccharide biosynthesis polyprenyl glycosylphosphotransferase
MKSNSGKTGVLLKQFNTNMGNPKLEIFPSLGMKIRPKFLMAFFLLVFDLLFLCDLFYIFALIRFKSEGSLWPVLFIPLVITLIVNSLINGYSLKTNMRSFNYAIEHVIAGLAALFFTIISVYAFQIKPAYLFGRGVLPLSYFTFIGVSLFYRRWIYSFLHKQQKQRYLIILGTGRLAKDVYLECLHSGINQKIRVLDVTHSKVGQTLCGVNSPVIEGVPGKQFESLHDTHDAIIFAEDRRKMKKEFVEKLIKCHFNGVPIISVEKFYEDYLQRIPSSLVNPQLLLGAGFDFPRNPVFEKFKRFIDIVLALFGLVLTSPCFVLIPLLLRWEDPDGPVVFKQLRTGKNNVPFNCYKFRTMTTSQKNSPVCTKKSDSRITKVGKWLRYSHLDELPQLWNVLNGDMSMIGPRPEQVKLTQVYEKQFFCYRFRHLARPGITGWAQVNYKYGEDLKDAIKKFEYDLYYFRNFSFKLDATIVLKTLTNITLGSGR